ncbi:MAG: SAM-dependent methyltransferase [Treponema sp.]|nr:SAM-dependent methyltransferase [Treponema sp.]
MESKSEAQEQNNFPHTRNKVLPEYNHSVVKNIRHFVVENIRSARRFLKSVDKDFNIDSCTFFELNEHSDFKNLSPIIKILENGVDVALVSEAGCPAIADPGAALVASAHKNRIRVVPLVGPASMILSLMASGFCGQNFSFVGYLPAKSGERAKKLRQLESRLNSEKQTQIFIEAPYRNMQVFETMLNTLNKNTCLCIASNITSEDEFICSKTIEQWKKKPPPNIQKVPTIFAIGFFQD